MSALAELVAKLRSALARLPERQVLEARKRIADELAPHFDQLSAGTASQDLDTARARLAALVPDIERVLASLRTAREKTEEWINEHNEHARPAATGDTPASSPTSENAPSRVTKYRAQLENPWPYGKPLKGWRLDQTGEHWDTELSSGTKLPSGQADPAYTAAADKAQALGLARGGFVPDIARHIEIKEASTMREGETRTIVIGKDPCGIDPVTNVSCHRFLRYFLPSNATLIVYGPTGKPYRYEGKRTS
jgi:hypothetical protein